MRERVPYEQKRVGDMLAVDFQRPASAKAAPPAGYTTGYNVVGVQQTGWTQYRIALDFATQTYTLSTRRAEGAAWTSLNGEKSSPHSNRL